MAVRYKFDRAGFVKAVLLSALLILLVPGFSLWFFHHVESDYDRRIREQIVGEIQADQSLSATARADSLAFYQKIRVSRILASNRPEARRLQEHFAPVKERYAVFRWMQRIALVCLAAITLVSVAVGAGMAVSSRSRNAQYRSLRIGWSLLRWFALIEVLGQGTLAAALSMWMPALWLGFYYPQMLYAFVLLAFFTATALVKAIFRKVNTVRNLEGRLIGQAAAPALWGQVCRMAERLGTPPPDNIFAGIDDNFFVTEHPVQVGGKPYTGRTLFVSLSLLKTLTRGEADAVLAHEMAHFSGEDTLYSRRTAPLLQKYELYLHALSGPVGWLVFHFLFLFWNLYHLSLAKISREREGRADRIAAELTSAREAAQALLRISAYSQYRTDVQKSLFEREENVGVMDVARRLEEGFPAFLGSAVNLQRVAAARAPHPFDSHPTLTERITSLGLDPASVLQSHGPLPEVQGTWFSAIDGAAEIEAEQWEEVEESLHHAHEDSLAYRFEPCGEAEVSLVVKYFPPLRFQTSKGVTLSLDYNSISLSGWEAPVEFAMIDICWTDEDMGGPWLVLEFRESAKPALQTRRIHLKPFKSKQGDVLQSFSRYYNRFLAAKAWQKQKGGKLDTVVT
jgi:Zn-dependent protease with chaperone function